jgi:hypothetical protein
MQVDSVVIVSGKISARDEKEPQILVDTLRPITDAATWRNASNGGAGPNGGRNGSAGGAGRKAGYESGREAVRGDAGGGGSGRDSERGSANGGGSAGGGGSGREAVRGSAGGTGSAVSNAHDDSGDGDITARSTQKKLYVKLASEDSPEYKRLKLILIMFPGNEPLVLHFDDTKKTLRDGRCVIHNALLAELQGMLGEGNVVVK